MDSVLTGNWKGCEMASPQYCLGNKLLEELRRVEALIERTVPDLRDGLLGKKAGLNFALDQLLVHFADAAQSEAQSTDVGYRRDRYWKVNG